MSLPRPTADVLSTRFWSYVEQRGPDECWPWKAGKFSNGYGQFRLDKQKVKAHRVAYALAVGPIPEGQVVRHRCDNPPCCNPKHLLPGTHADNTADREERGRSANNPLPVLRGEANPSAKLTSESVALIRSAIASGRAKAALAREYGVSHSLIRQISRGTAWRT